MTEKEAMQLTMKFPISERKYQKKKHKLSENNFIESYENFSAQSFILGQFQEP